MAVRIPPVLVVVAFALLIALVASLAPQWNIDFAGREWLAVAILALGIVVIVLGVIAFHRAGTTVNPLDLSRTSSIVTRGIYGWSRNPMYLGFALLLAALVIFFGNPLALPLLAIYVMYMNRFQIRAEERALAALFGASYEDYCRQTRRWI